MEVSKSATLSWYWQKTEQIIRMIDFQVKEVSI